jgi:cytochrome P450
VPDGVDLLSLFLENEDVYKEDDTIDELLDFFGAATQTTQFALQTFTTMLTQHPEALKKIRAEFKKSVESSEIETTGLNKGQLLKKVLNLQMIHDLEYMNWSMMESLRIQPAGSVTTNLILTKDAKVGELYLKKGDEFMVNLVSLAHDAQ